MNKATLALGAMAPLLLLPFPVSAQPGKCSREQEKRLEVERKATIKELSTAIRNKASENAIHEMRVLMRLYANEKGAEEVARSIAKVLEGHFPCELAKTRAMVHLKELGAPGIETLERALLTTLRNQPEELQLNAIRNLVEAGHPASWNTLLRVARDKNQMVALAAIKALPNWKQVPPNDRKDLTVKILGLMRPPTPEEIQKDLELPIDQRALREALAEITGQRLVAIEDWRNFLAKWYREGCPVCPATRQAKADGSQPAEDQKPVQPEKSAEPKAGDPKENQNASQVRATTRR